MTTVHVTLQQPEEPTILQTEMRHVSELSRAGIPMKRHTLFYGPEAGVLSWSDTDTHRIYQWEPGVITPEPKVFGVFDNRYEIHKFHDASNMWFQVYQKPWYWPFWGYWTHKGEPTEFPTLNEARQAITFRRNGLGVQHKLVERTPI